MRAIKLITLSTVAVLAAGTSLAIGAGSSPSGSSIRQSSPMGQSTPRGSEPNKNLSSRMSVQPKTALVSPGKSKLHKRQGGTSGPAFARASSKELEAGMNPPERPRIREFMRDMPRLSNVGAELRVNAIVPRSVRMAAAPLPQEVQRMYPRLKRDRAFVYRDQIVIVNPATSRIVAVVQA